MTLKTCDICGTDSLLRGFVEEIPTGTKMMRILILSVFLGLVLADPVPKISSSVDNLDATVYEVEGEATKRVARLVPDTTSLVFEVINALIGQKYNALSLAVFVIHWLVSNCVIIVVGAVAALGLCKLTGKCSLSYEEILPVPVSQLTSPPPRHYSLYLYRHPPTQYFSIALTRFLVSAIEKYVEDRKRRSPNPLSY
ncbi:hypothetical protein evm_001696 [Chilo suppressalis]|nr:hypothetical protein evm_001696 [Chilo suppressalis]